MRVVSANGEEMSRPTVADEALARAAEAAHAEAAAQQLADQAKLDAAAAPARQKAAKQAKKDAAKAGKAEKKAAKKVALKDPIRGKIAKKKLEDEKRRAVRMEQKGEEKRVEAEAAEQVRLAAAVSGATLPGEITGEPTHCASVVLGCFVPTMEMAGGRVVFARDGPAPDWWLEYHVDRWILRSTALRGTASG